MHNKKFMKRILFIIFLTNLPLLIILPIFYKEVIGWLCGSIASAGNFYWLFRQVNSLNIYDDKDSSKRAGAGFYTRYLSIVVWSFAVMILLKPNVILFGLGLFSAQISIYINEAYEFLKKGPWGKYYRGDQDE